MPHECDSPVATLKKPVTTLAVAVPVLPSLEAVIVTGPPTATPVTRPCEDTLTIAVLLDDHVTVRPVSVLPAASLRMADSCAVPFSATDSVAGDTVTVATGGGTTVIVA